MKNWTIATMPSLASWIFVKETKTGRPVTKHRANLKTTARWYADLWHKERHENV